MLSVTKIMKRRRVEGPSGGLYPRQEIPIHHSINLTVCRKLAGIIAKLEPLSKQHGTVKFLKNAGHANTLNGFVQGLAYAVTDYQV